MSLYSTRCWAEQSRIESFLSLLETIDGGSLLPERWNSHEPFNKPYGEAARPEILRELVECRFPGTNYKSGTAWFVRRSKHPVRVMIESGRGPRPWPSHLGLELGWNTYGSELGSSRLRAIFEAFIGWGEPMYGLVHVTGVPHYRFVPLTPLQRLSQVGWLNFFGAPYIQMFGEPRLRGAAWHSVENSARGGLLCQAAPFISSPDIASSASRLLGIEEHLGADAFATQAFPEVPCRVPDFDVSDLICTPPVIPSPKTVGRAAQGQKKGQRK